MPSLISSSPTVHPLKFLQHSFSILYLSNNAFMHARFMHLWCFQTVTSWQIWEGQEWRENAYWWATHSHKELLVSYSNIHDRRETCLQDSWNSFIEISEMSQVWQKVLNCVTLTQISRVVWTCYDFKPPNPKRNMSSGVNNIIIQQHWKPWH